jgi:hypothetical protein
VPHLEGSFPLLDPRPVRVHKKAQVKQQIQILNRFAILENPEESTQSNKTGIKNVCDNVKISSETCSWYQHVVEKSTV